MSHLRVGVVLLVVLALSAFMSPAHCAIIRVKLDSTYDGPGSDWAHGYRSVQTAINMAFSGDEIWVAAGIYTGRITLKSGVSLYGGFNGTETTRGQRNWQANVAILDANKTGSVVTAPSGATSTCRIDGFRITNGTGQTISGSTYKYGGGIYCRGSSPSITNNTISGNTADHGGGISCYSSASPAITGNTISGNTGYWGGGIDCYTSSNPTISDNILTGNSGSYGSGINCISSSPSIQYNTIDSNIGTGRGICCIDYSSPVIRNNRITRNKGNSGGGIYCQESNPTITSNMIIANTASSGGGIYCDYLSSPWITSNIIAANVSEYGGGIYVYLATPSVVNNTIVGNTGTAGGGVRSQDPITLKNNIIAYNSSGVHINGSSTLERNCVFGNEDYNYKDITPNATNFSADPKLASTAYGNLHIQTDSPCKDAGTAVTLPWPFDVDGHTRVNGTIDIGADESWAEVWTVNPGIIRVSPDGSDANSGLSWAQPKQSIQAALDAVWTQGGEVWVKAGTYNERITLMPFTYVYGGFSGTETTRSQRDPKQYASIIDGQKGGSVLSATLCGHLLSSIDGCTIKNGSGTLHWNNNACGGGVFCYHTTPIINNNLISGNWAYYGGAVYSEECNPRITNNTITGNGGNNGAAIFCYTYASPTVSNNIIAGNGSGIGCQYYSKPAIVNNTIIGNGCDGNPAIRYDSQCSPRIVNNIIALNYSGVDAGNGNSVVEDNCLWGNTTFNYKGFTPSASNIIQDPLLASYNYGNIHIQNNSPCKDAGDDTAVTSGSLDMDAQARVQGAHVDIGADESDSTTWTQGSYAVIRVTPEGSDSNDGSGWDSAHAKRTVQAAIDAASVGGQVWVKAGTYNDRIKIGPYVHVYGGFMGTEMQLWQRSPSINRTTIDAQQSGSAAYFANTGYLPNTIDGFTLRNGNGTQSGSFRYGGGVYCSNASPLISNNTIRDNSGARNGGGIYCAAGAPRISANVISDNSASFSGAGIYSNPGSYSVIVNNLITRNNSGDVGGGVFMGPAAIINNTIVNNGTSSYGGGVWCSTVSTAINNIVAFNSSGLILSGSSGTPVYKNNCVYGNTAGDYYNWATDPTGTNGNIKADPKLVLGPDGLQRPGKGSPCIDTGANDGSPTVDIEGHIRPQDGDEIDTAICDIGAHEYPLDLSKAKTTYPDGKAVAFGGMSVTAQFPGCIYVEKPDRSLGIRVDTSEPFIQGQMINVSGSVQTDPATGERFIALPWCNIMTGTFLSSPLGIGNGILGGGTNGLVEGAAGSFGLNNTGLLVKIWGKVVEKDVTWFKLTDGTGASVKCVVPAGVVIDPDWQYVSATGISSCEKIGSQVHSLVRVRSQEDITAF